MADMKPHDIAEPRNRHLQLVETRPRTSPRHPSMQPVTLFDQHDPEVHAADRCVLLTMIEAKAIVSMLQQGRPHSPSPVAVDEAIEILTGRRP